MNFIVNVLLFGTCLVLLPYHSDGFTGPYSEIWSISDLLEDGRFIGKVRVPVLKNFKNGWKLTVKFDRVTTNIEVRGAVKSYCTKKGKTCNIANLPGDDVGGVGSKITFDFIGMTSDGSYPLMEVRFKGQTFGRNEDAVPTEDSLAINATTMPETTQTVTTTQAPLHTAVMDYNKALKLSLKFFEGQRSGWVEGTTSLPWKRDVGIYDGASEGVDLVGGYHLRGGYVKFNYPTAFAITQLAWGGIAFWDSYVKAGEADNLLKALKWGTDYLMKIHTDNEVVYSRVGLASIDHSQWESASNMNWERPASKITVETPGSDLAAEVSAALSASSMLFRGVAPEYVDELERHARILFNFADLYRGINPEPEYKSTGYMDELIWASLWLFKTNERKRYLDFAVENYATHFANQTSNGFNYDNKTLGIQILLADLTGDLTYMEPVYEFCNRPGGENDFYLEDGLLTRPGEICPVQLASNAAFICSFAIMNSKDGDSKMTYDTFVRSQINRILGARGTQGYMVGYGTNYPQRIHHRDSSCPLPPEECGWYFFHSFDENAFVLEGAIVGGPDSDGAYNDQRPDWAHNQPNILFNAAFQSVLAFLIGQDTQTGSASMVIQAETYAPPDLVTYFKTTQNKEYDSCLSNPCQNDGECLFLGDLNYFCRCPFNTFGVVCENKFEPEIRWLSKWNTGAEIYIYFPNAMDVELNRMGVIWPAACPLKHVKVWDSCLIPSETDLETGTLTFQQVGWFVDKSAVGMTFEYGDSGYTLACTSTDDFRFKLTDIADANSTEFENYAPENCPRELPPPVAPPTMEPGEIAPPVTVETIPPEGITIFTTPTTTSECPLCDCLTATNLELMKQCLETPDAAVVAVDMKPLVTWENTYGFGGQAHINIDERKPNVIGGWMLTFIVPSFCKITSAQFWDGCVVDELKHVENGTVVLEQIDWQLQKPYIGMTVQFELPTATDCFDSDGYKVIFQDVQAGEIYNANPDTCPKSFP